MGIDYRIRALIPIILILFSCQKEPTESKTIKPSIIIQKVEIQFSFMVDGKPIKPQELIYESGVNEFGVDSLSLIIGSLEFMDNQGVPFLIEKHHLIDVNNDSTWIFSNLKVNNLGKIVALKVCLGLSSYNNEVYYDLDDAKMNYPGKINGIKTGGGYYACKLKGTFLNNNKPDNYELDFSNKYRSSDSTFTKFNICHIVNITEFDLYEGSNLLKISINVDDFFGNKERETTEIKLSELNEGLDLKGDTTKLFSENVISSFELTSITHP